MLLGFALLRTGGFNTETPLFGTWHRAPRWARLLFGSVQGDIRPFRLYLEALCLVWGLGFTISGVTGDPPGPPLRQIISAISLAAFAACVVGMVVATVGQQVRQWRIDHARGSGSEDRGNGGDGAKW